MKLCPVLSNQTYTIIPHPTLFLSLGFEYMRINADGYSVNRRESLQNQMNKHCVKVQYPKMHVFEVSGDP